MVSVTDLVSKVRNRVANVPSAVTDAMIDEYLDDSIIEVQNITGDTISSTSIDTKYQSILTDLGAIKVMRYMLQPNFSLGGELSISRGGRGQILDLIRDMDKKIANDLSQVKTSGGVSTTEPEINLP